MFFGTGIVQPVPVKKDLIPFISVYYVRHGRANGETNWALERKNTKKIFSTVADCLILPSPDVVDTTRQQASHTLGKNIPALGLARKKSQLVCRSK
jgi:hypothetical protein